MKPPPNDSDPLLRGFETRGRKWFPKKSARAGNLGEAEVGCGGREVGTLNGRGSAFLESPPTLVRRPPRRDGLETEEGSGSLAPPGFGMRHGTTAPRARQTCMVWDE